MLWLALLFAPFFAAAQQPAQLINTPKGQFLQDSALLGDTLHFALWYRHNRALQVLFPDTSLRLPNFEILSKRYFPTRTTDSISLDSTVYVVRSFELQPHLTLSLPVYLLNQNDSAVIYSTTDTVKLIELVKELPAGLQLAENIAPVSIPQRFNYPVLLLFIVISLLLLGVLFLIFGKPIKRLYYRYMAQTKFKAFKSRFDSLIRKFRRGQKTQTLEEAVTLWKNYLTDLEERPINSFTTKEIAQYYNEEKIGDVLKLCDKAIYGNVIENEQNETTGALLHLKEFSVMRYHQLQNLPADAEPVNS